MENQKKEFEIKLPDGKFNYCTGNCSCCCYYNPYDTNSRGEAYCSYYGSYYSPRQRQGCRSHKCRN